MHQTIHKIIQQVTQKITSISTTPRLDAELILCHIIQKPRSFIYAHPEYILIKSQINKLESLLKQRQRGIPISHLIGHKEFWDFNLKVSKDVLTPRPETELLVELALKKIEPPAKLTIADLGTGSGAIALTIAKERPNCQVIGIEKNPAALKIARANRRQLKISNLNFRSGDWNKRVPNNLDLIVSNPPYIESQDPCLATAPLKFEPRSALASGKDGLNAIRQIIALAEIKLKPQAWLIIEHGYNQRQAIQKFLNNGNWHNIQTHKDLNTLDRVTLAQLRSA